MKKNASGSKKPPFKKNYWKECNYYVFRKVDVGEKKNNQQLKEKTKKNFFILLPL